MRPSLEIRQSLHQYQHKLQLTFVSAEIGLDRQIKLTRQTSDTFEAADYFNVIRTSSIVVVGYQAIGENLQSSTVDSCDAPTNMASEQ